jgi:hypothetical protein
MPKSKEKPEGLFGTDVPVGGIIMYVGNLESLDADTWAVCDGKVHKGKQTPNLVDRLPIGTATLTQVGQSTEGSLVHQHPFSGTTGTFNGAHNNNVKQDDGAPLSVPGVDHTHNYSGTTGDGGSLPPVTRVFFILRIA